MGEGWTGSLELADINYHIYSLEWIKNKVLLYSTENCIQYPVINHNGKEYEKKIHICIIESLLYTEIKITLNLYFNKSKKF